MHEFLTVLKLILGKSKQYHFPSCAYVNWVCRPAAAERTLNLLVSLHRPHPSMQVNSSCSNSTAMATFSLCWIYHQAMTKNRSRLLLCSRLGSTLENARHLVPFVQECISIATLVCAHGTANLTNRGPSELVEECIFCALQVRTQTI